MKRRSADDTTVRISETVVPKLPHERDESTARKVRPVQPIIEQAAEDLDKGRTDTDRGPETNRLARRLNSRNQGKNNGKE